MPDIELLLRAALGGAVSTDPVALAAMQTDRSGRVSETPPLAIVNARSIEDVQATLRIADQNGVPVVPRGAGTGLAGGAIGGAGEIVLSMALMDGILEINADDELAVVQPGILNDDLNVTLEPYGLWFSPDPASKAISTIGGNIATNAGGLLCAKYGVTRESVLGLKVVLADGRLLTLGHRTVKGVTGYDLTALFVGSEGTLGVVVEATLKLRALPVAPKTTLGARFATIEQAAGAASAITAARLQPAAMELIGQSALDGIRAYLAAGDNPLDGPSGSYLLLQWDDAAAQSAADSAVAIVRSFDGDASISSDPAEGERLFELRRAFHPAMAARGTVLIEDVAVPRSQLSAMFRAISEIEERLGIEIPTVAHAGDGNLHPNFVFAGAEVPAEVWEAADEVFRACLRLGGTLTGEHGVGVLKKRWLRDELGDDQWELQRRLKSVFDPKNLLNPGKVF